MHFYPQADAADASPLIASVTWVEALLTGSVATTVAILAIAALGVLLMGGHRPARRAVRVIVGCFILFSAGAIGNGLSALAAGSRADPSERQAIAGPSEAAPAYQPTIPQLEQKDPFGGAAAPPPEQSDL